MKLQSLFRNLGLTLLCVVLSAHVGSPDAWFEGNAGPYKVTIQVQMAGVVPGVAQIFVTTAGDKPDRHRRRKQVRRNRWGATARSSDPRRRFSRHVHRKAVAHGARLEQHHR